MGGSDSGTRVSVQVLVLMALTVMLFATVRYVPVLGILVSLFAPTPLLVVTLRHGLRIGLLALGLSTLSLAMLFGSLQSTIFFAEYGVMALAMAEAIRMQLPVEKTLLVATVAPVVASGLVMVALLAVVDVDLSAMKQHVEHDLSQTFHQYLTEEDGAVAGDLGSYLRETLATVVRLLPAIFVISTAAAALVNYSLVRVLWRRLGDRKLFPEMTLTHWKAPEACVWILIASGVCFFLPWASVQSVGLNVLLLIGLIYLIQGFCLMVFYLNKASVPPLFRSIAYLVLVIQPLLLLGLAAFGLFDLWFDFRRLSNQREKSP